MPFQITARHRVLATTFAALATLTAVAAGCSGSPTKSESTGGVGTLNISAPSTSATAAVPEVEPVAEGPCPYLSVDEVEKLNGEKVKEVKTDNRIDPPACFFASSDGKTQLSSTVYTVGSADEAIRLVNKTVPVNSSERTELADGWNGGKNGGPSGALLAVAKDARVVVIHSVQEQSIKAQRVAELMAPRIG